MSADQSQWIKEHLELQREFKEYVDKNGFDYAAYCGPAPGSFYERYRKRWAEVTNKLTTPLRPA